MPTRSEILKSKFSPLHFGTSGIRSFVSEMTDMECYIITRGFIKYLYQKNEIESGAKIVLGGDLRQSTPRIMKAIHQAILDENCQTLFCGFVPTPTLSLYAWKRNLPGIMVTGSHIPEDQNGIKFIRSFGEVLKSDEKDILSNIEITREEEYIKNEENSLFDMNGYLKIPEHLPEISEEKNAIEEFEKRYIDLFQTKILDGKKIVLYEQSAVGRDILKNILNSIGAEVICVERSKKFIPIDTEKVSEHVIKSFEKWAKEFQPFAIVSTDGDSDRPLLADENGTFLPGDLLGLLVSLYLKPEFVSIPVSSNDAITTVLKNLNIEFVLTKIGSPYCIDAMNKKLSENENAKVVSWERNGGYLLGGDWNVNNHRIKALPTRDSILPLIITLIFATEENVSMSTLIKDKIPNRFIIANAIDNKTAGCESYSASLGKIIIQSFSPKDLSKKELNFNSSEINENEEAKRIKNSLESYFSLSLGYAPIQSINYTDGVRISFTNGDVSHLRPSSNSPEFRIYATSDTKERAEKIVKDRLDIMPKIISDTLANS